MSERHAAHETGAQISREGAIAAQTVVAVLLVSGVTLIAASWDELWRPCGTVVSPCVNRASTAALIDLFSIAAIGSRSVSGGDCGGAPSDQRGALDT